MTDLGIVTDIDWNTSFRGNWGISWDMIAHKQCLACNTLMTTASKSCACGHVLEDTPRFICGKRFTEYRMKMYSRLENKRMKSKERENGSRKNRLPESFQERKNQSTDKPIRQPNNKNRRRRRRFAPFQKNLTSTSTVQERGSKSVEVPSELLSRFPRALQEINRRILGQNFMWFLLSWLAQSDT